MDAPSDFRRSIGYASAQRDGRSNLALEALTQRAARSRGPFVLVDLGFGLFRHCYRAVDLVPLLVVAGEISRFALDFLSLRIEEIGRTRRLGVTAPLRDQSRRKPVLGPFAPQDRRG